MLLAKPSQFRCMFQGLCRLNGSLLNELQTFGVCFSCSLVWLWIVLHKLSFNCVDACYLFFLLGDSFEYDGNGQIDLSSNFLSKLIFYLLPPGILNCMHLFYHSANGLGLKLLSQMQCLLVLVIIFINCPCAWDWVWNCFCYGNHTFFHAIKLNKIALVQTWFFLFSFLVWQFFLLDSIYTLLVCPSFILLHITRSSSLNV